MTIAKSGLRNWAKVVIALILCAGAGARASTIWTGPITNFFHSEGGLADQIVPGVKITRGSDGGLYNADTESSAVNGLSPEDTLWAQGSITNIANLKFAPCPLESGSRPPNDVNKTYVVHLVAEDIYFSLTLTAWGGQSGNGPTSFSYARTTPSAAPPPTPTVSITSPANGANFIAPANVEIDATASVSSGSVTNVEFFTNGISAGSVPAAPFTLTASDLVAGAYSLTAVATAAGISATSAVITITVTNAVVPPTVMVAITNPPDGATFTAPATLEIDADATASSGNVTNVEFFTNGVSLGSVQNPPFSLTISNVAAGGYLLTALASAGGISAGSLVVIVTVTNPALPPSLTVEITSPTNGATFTAPATVDLTASTTATNATVTDVQYFTNGVLFGSAQTPPYSLTASNFLAGSYSLTAVALAGGITATSLVVNISVTNAVSGPPPINVTSPGVVVGQFTFSYSTQAGISYVIESSTNLVTWIPVATNPASGGASQFSGSFDETGDVYYRVSQVATP